MIVLAGGSWAVGEWSNDHTPSHLGLYQYLQDDGYEVVTVSGPGLSNQQSYYKISEIFTSGMADFFKNKIEKIFIFQVDWFKDHKSPDNEINMSTYNYATHTNTLSAWYQRLSELALKYSVSIGIIGGNVDAIWLDKFKEHYPGVFIACQSMTNLCINDQHRIQDPVYGIYYKLLVQNFRGCATDTQSIEFLLDESDRGQQRLLDWEQNPQWFYPDGLHANRHGHKKLYDFLKQQEYI